MNLSIIIPTFNSGRVIADCLDSIVNQKVQPAEVLVIDNLSQDQTASIVAAFISQYPWIKFFSAADTGIYDAMNTGISLAKSELLYFMGSDDKFASNDVLSYNLQEKLNSYDVVYGDVYSMNSDSIYDGVFTYEKLLNINICQQAIFFHKTVFQLTGKFNLKYRIHADWDNNLKWFNDTRIKHCYIDQVIAVYGAGGLSSTTGDEKFYLTRKWKYLLHKKTSISVSNRLRMLKALLKDMDNAGMRREINAILIRIPLLFIPFTKVRH